MERILQTMRSFWVCLQELSSFEQILLTVLSVAVLIFIFRRAKITKIIISRFRRWAIRYQSFRYRTLWEPVVLSIIIVGIFICFFGEKLLMEMDQDTVRNLILLTAGVIGWYFLYQRTKTADQSKKVAEKRAETAEKHLTIERLTRAMEQIAHEKSYVRVGGIRGLEKIAYTEEEDNVKIAQILATFIQAQAAKNSERTEKNIFTYKSSKPEIADNFSLYRSQRLDVEAAVHALANIALRLERQGYFEQKNSKPKKDLCDLRNTDLRGLQLNKIDLSNFNFLESDFSYASLIKTNFTRSIIGNIINFKKENMTKFIWTYLTDAIFSDALVFYTDFSHSTLTNATFDGAHLMGAILDECCINQTHFETSKDLTQGQINKTYYLINDSPPFLPEGLKPPKPRISKMQSSMENKNPFTGNDENLF